MSSKGAFAEMIRVVQNSKTLEEDECIECLDLLCEDLGFIEILARAFPEEELKKLEADAETPLWP